MPDDQVEDFLKTARGGAATADPVADFLATAKPAATAEAPKPVDPVTADRMARLKQTGGVEPTGPYIPPQGIRDFAALPASERAGFVADVNERTRTENDAADRASHGALRRYSLDAGADILTTMGQGALKGAVAFNEGLDAGVRGAVNVGLNAIDSLPHANPMESRADLPQDPGIARAREYVERTAAAQNPNVKALASVTDPIAEMAGNVASQLVAGPKFFSLATALQHPDNPLVEGAKAELFVRFQGALGKALAGADPTKIDRVASTGFSTWMAAVASGEDPIKAIGPSIAFAGHEMTKAAEPRLGVNNPGATVAERFQPSRDDVARAVNEAVESGQVAHQEAVSPEHAEVALKALADGKDPVKAVDAMEGAVRPDGTSSGRAGLPPEEALAKGLIDPPAVPLVKQMLADGITPVSSDAGLDGNGVAIGIDPSGKTVVRRGEPTAPEATPPVPEAVAPTESVGEPPPSARPEAPVRPAPKPMKPIVEKNLVEWVRAQGGVNEGSSGYTGEIEALSPKETGTTGLLNRKGTGQDLEALHRAAIHEQLVPEEMTLSEFYDVLKEGAAPKPKLSPDEVARQKANEQGYSSDEAARHEEYKAGQDAENAAHDAAPETPTSNKKRVMDRERAAMGLEPMPSETPQTREGWKAEAQRVLAANPMRAHELMKEIADGKQPRGPVDIAVLDIHRVNLHKARAAADARGRAAQARGDAEGVAEAKAAAEAAVSDFRTLDAAARSHQREWGRAGVAIQMEMLHDYSLKGLEERAIRDNDYKPLSKEKMDEIEALAAAHKKATEDLAKANSRADFAEAALALEKIKKSGSRSAPPQRSSSEYGAKNKIVTREAYEKTKAELRSILGSTTLGSTRFLDPTILAKVVKLGTFHVEAGVTKFSEWAKAMTDELGDKVTPYLRDAWAASRPTEDVKSVGDVVDEMKKGVKSKEESFDLVKYAGKLMNAVVASGVHEIEKVGPAVQKALREIDPEITLSETHRAMTDYGHKIEMDQDPLKKEVRDLKAQAVQIERQLDIASGKLPPPQGLQRDTPSDALRKLVRMTAEAKRKSGLVTVDSEAQVRSALDAAKTRMLNRIKDMRAEMRAGVKDVPVKSDPLAKADEATKAEHAALRAEYEATVKEYRETFGKPGLTDQQRLDMAIKATKRAIELRRERNEAGDVFPEKKKAGPTSPELDALRIQLSDLNAIADDMRDAATPKMSEVEKQARAALRGIAKRTARMEKQIAENDFAKKQRRVRQPTPEEIAAKRDQLQVEHRWADARQRDMLARETKKAKAIRVAFKEIPALLRVFNITFDFGSALVQGGLRGVGHPVEAAQTFKKGFKSFLSAEARALDDARILSDPGYEAAVRQKAGFTGLDPSGKVDETIRSNWMDKAPVLRNFNRFTHTMLNNLRLNAAKAATTLVSHGGEPTAEEHRVIGEAVNIITGRGQTRNRSANSFLDSATVLALAPRYALSRVQAALGVPMWRGTARTRKAFATEYVRSAAGVGVLILLAKALGQEVDKYGTIHVGNTSIDTTMGLAQVWKLAGKLYESAVEDDVKERDQSRTFVGDYVRGKLSPIPGAIVSRTMGKTIAREDATYPNLAKNMFLPLVARDYIDAAREHDSVVAGLAFAGLSAIGARVNTIMDPEPKPKHSRYSHKGSK